MIKMAVVSRSVYMDAPPEEVFKYYARPEHIAGTFPEESKMKIFLNENKENFLNVVIMLKKMISSN